MKSVKNTGRMLAQKTSNVFRKVWTGMCAVFAGLMAYAAPAYADPVKVETNLTTEGVVGGIVGFIVDVAKWIGIVVVVSGIFMFIFAYKDDNAESQSRAIRFAVIGALMIGLELILKTAGLIK